MQRLPDEVGDALGLWVVVRVVVVVVAVLVMRVEVLNVEDVDADVLVAVEVVTVRDVVVEELLEPGLFGQTTLAWRHAVMLTPVVKIVIVLVLKQVAA